MRAMQEHTFANVSPLRSWRAIPGLLGVGGTLLGPANRLTLARDRHDRTTGAAALGACLAGPGMRRDPPVRDLTPCEVSSAERTSPAGLTFLPSRETSQRGEEGSDGTST